MTPERWQQIERLYDAALERETGARAAFVADACAGDEELRREVELLLAANEKAGSFMAAPAFALQAETLAAEPPPSPAETERRSIGRYRILSRIGAGGMGEVWLAEDTTLHRKVALKLLPAAFMTNPDRVRRFEQEARAASALNHPNIITVHEVGVANGTHYLVTEFVDGRTLREQIAKRGLPFAQALDIALQIAAALAAAHEAGIIHRDIKPENVMIRRDGYVKVLDFGLAKLTEPQTPAVDSEAPTIAKVNTDTGIVLGTASYMSPEQARGLKVDARTDVFSLGVVLYEMIAGHRPFTGETTMDVLAAILSQEPARLTQPAFNEEAPPDELQRIVGKMLRKAPDDRYQTVRDLMVDLKSLKQEIEFQKKLGRSQTSGVRGQRAAIGSAARPIESEASITPSQASGAAHAHSSIEIILGEIKQHRMGVAVTLTIFALALAAGGYGLYRLISGNRQAENFRTMKLSKLTATSEVTRRLPAMSPDGNYVAYVEADGAQRSLWVKHVATGSTVQIVPPSKVDYVGQTFSPDSNYIFYAVRDGRTPSILYRVPVLGGPPLRILAGVDSPITFSPDGRRFAFAGKEYTALMIAGTDGAPEQEIISHQSEKRFVYPAWSPDGKIIACGVVLRTASESYLTAVNVEDGTEKPISSRKWARILGVAWMSNGRNLVLSAADKESKEYQIWKVHYPAGEAHRVTNDLSNYWGVSLTADAKHLVSVRNEMVSNIWVAPEGDTSRGRQITTGTENIDGLLGIVWTPDGRIVHSAQKDGTENLWIIDADGGNLRQLTNTTSNNYYPAVTPDGRYIVFTSKRTGNDEIWRMDMDGGNLKQLTAHSGNAFMPQSSADSRWVVYLLQRDEKRTLWKAPIEGGQPARLTAETSYMPAISPDGKLIVCNYGEGTQDSPVRLAIFPFEGGDPVKRLDLPSVIASYVKQWTSDSRGLFYMDARDGVGNIWRQPLSGGSPKQVTYFKNDRVFNFNWSRDGKKLACARGHGTTDVVLISNF